MKNDHSTVFTHNMPKRHDFDVFLGWERFEEIIHFSSETYDDLHEICGEYLRKSMDVGNELRKSNRVKRKRKSTREEVLFWIFYLAATKVGNVLKGFH